MHHTFIFNVHSGSGIFLQNYGITKSAISQKRQNFSYIIPEKTYLKGINS